MEKRSQQDRGNPERNTRLKQREKERLNTKYRGEGLFACLSHEEAEDQGKWN